MTGLRPSSVSILPKQKLRRTPAAAFIAGFLLIGSQAFAAQTSYQYDDLGRVIGVTSPNGTQTTYTYDAANNRTQFNVSTAPAAPTVGNTSLTVSLNTAGTVALLPSGTYTSLAIATGPSHGSASISGTTATYTPTSGYSGSDSFTYTATGPGGTSSPGTVTVTVQASVNHAPTCNNWTQNMSNVPVFAGPVTASFPASAFTYQCSDADGDTLTVTSPAMPLNVTISAHQALSYTITVSDGHGGTGSLIFTVTRP